MREYYKHGAKEAIEIIADMLADASLDGYEAFCIGNIVKYLSRHKHKGAPIGDLRKAQGYLELLIEHEITFSAVSSDTTETAAEMTD